MKSLRTWSSSLTRRLWPSQTPSPARAPPAPPARRAVRRRRARSCPRGDQSTCAMRSGPRGTGPVPLAKRSINDETGFAARCEGHDVVLAQEEIELGGVELLRAREIDGVGDDEKIPRNPRPWAASWLDAVLDGERMELNTPSKARPWSRAWDCRGRPRGGALVAAHEPQRLKAEVLPTSLPSLKMKERSWDRDAATWTERLGSRREFKYNGLPVGGKANAFSGVRNRSTALSHPDSACVVVENHHLLGESRR